MTDTGLAAEKIPEIDPELFTYELYEMNFGDRFGLYHNMYPEVFEFENFVKALAPKAVGRCDPSRLAVRPKALRRCAKTGTARSSGSKRSARRRRRSG